MANLNPFVGPAKVFVKSPASNTSPVVSNTMSTAGWTQLGWKDGKGVKLADKTKRDDLEVEEFNTPVGAVLTNEDVTVSLDLVKSDLSDLQYAITGSTLTTTGLPAGQKQTISGGGGSINFFSLAIQGYAPSGKQVVVWVPKVTAGDSFDVTFKKGKTTVPFEFVAYADTTQPVGSNLFKIYELT